MKGLRGINPDLPESKAEKAIEDWLKVHNNNKANHKKTA